MFLEKKIKYQNKRTVFILAILAISWRLLIWNSLKTAAVDPYIFPVFGFFMLAVIFGEITRQFFNFFKSRKSRRVEHKTEREKREEKQALFFAILWSLIWIGLTIFLRFESLF